MNAVWLVVVFCSCLDLIGIGSTLTIVAIFNITAPALDLSYIAVIVAHRYYEKRVRFIEGPYTMGVWSKPINAIAVTWVLFISVVLFFPTTKPVTPTNMNYAICVAGFIAIFSMTWWFVGANKYVECSFDMLSQLLTDSPLQEVYWSSYQGYSGSPPRRRPRRCSRKHPRLSPPAAEIEGHFITRLSTATNPSRRFSLRCFVLLSWPFLHI